MDYRKRGGRIKWLSSGAHSRIDSGGKNQRPQIWLRVGDPARILTSLCTFDAKAGGKTRSEENPFLTFQLMPTLTVIESVMLPMDFYNIYHSLERPFQAMSPFERVGITEQVDKFPAELSSGQQKRMRHPRLIANLPTLNYIMTAKIYIMQSKLDMFLNICYPSSRG